MEGADEIVERECENGSFQNNDAASSSRSRRTASTSAPIQQHQFGPTSRSVKEQEGTLKLETTRGGQRSSTILTTKPTKRTQSAIPDAAINEFEFLPHQPDTDARTQALRMYYLELSENVSSSDAQARVSKVFSISPCTVKRWAAAWEDIGEEALIDLSGFHEGMDKSILFLSPALVTELKLWIQKHLKQGGKENTKMDMYQFNKFNSTSMKYF